jgi:flagella basal body P-ring formation protein FlgA
MKLIGLIIFTLLIASLLVTEIKACEIILHSQIIYESPSDLLKKPESLFKEIKNCPEKLALEVANFLIESEGEIHQNVLQEHLLQRFNISTQITPTNLNAISLTTLLTKKLDNSQEFLLENIILNSHNKILTLNESETLNIKCDECLKPGHQKLILFINKREGLEKFWIDLEISKKVLALKSISNINYNSAYSEQLFEKVWINTKTPEKYTFNFSDLSFQKTVRTIEKGTLITADMWRAVNLVQAGSTVNIIFQSTNLSVSSKALAKQSGKFGDVIQLINITTKKNINGTIIGKDQVKVEL